MRIIFKIIPQNRLGARNGSALCVYLLRSLYIQTSPIKTLKVTGRLIVIRFGLEVALNVFDVVSLRRVFIFNTKQVERRYGSLPIEVRVLIRDRTGSCNMNP